jgi:hypothetical protein
MNSYRATVEALKDAAIYVRNLYRTTVEALKDVAVSS